MRGGDVVVATVMGRRYRLTRPACIGGRDDGGRITFLGQECEKEPTFCEMKPSPALPCRELRDLIAADFPTNI